jgi:GTPase SAR1 family protein
VRDSDTHYNIVSITITKLLIIAVKARSFNDNVSNLFLSIFSCLLVLIVREVR